MINDEKMINYETEKINALKKRCLASLNLYVSLES
jgi:hypothetical protein